MATLFEKIAKQALEAGVTPRTRESMIWFARKLRSMQVGSREALIRSKEFKRRSRLNVTLPLIGTVHMFRYEPKNETKLPYYDQYPLVIIVDRAKGGFLGLNIHYLPVLLRARFLDVLYKDLNNEKFDETTRMNTRWRRVNRGLTKKFLKPMIKHYLSDHVDGYIAQVYPDEWDTAMFLPFQRFRKANQNTVWRDSYQQIYSRLETG